MDTLALLADKKSRGSPGSSVICGTDDSSARVQIGWFSNASSSNLRTQPVQQPWQIGQVSNVKGVKGDTLGVQQPWQIGQVSNLFVQIPRLNRDYLFQRTAKSARSSCFCDPPDRFSIRLSDLRKRLFPPRRRYVSIIANSHSNANMHRGRTKRHGLYALDDVTRDVTIPL